MLLVPYIRFKKKRIMANKIIDISKIRKAIKFYCSGIRFYLKSQNKVINTG